MISKNDPSDKKQIYSQLNSGDLSENAEKKQKSVFCPACGRNVPLSFIVAGLCEDCFKND